MTEVIPFRGIYYNREKVSGDEVIAPPYDLITPEMREELYGRNPYNVVRIDFGKKLSDDNDGQNKYTRAAELFETWQREGMLKRSEKQSFYAYRMEYSLNGEERSITGLFGLVKLVELGKGVFPHEATHSKPKSDRLALMEASGANTSPIFALYSTPKGDVPNLLSMATSQDPYLQARDADGSVHSFWIIEEPGMVDAIREQMQGAAIFIADGHHRYETALDYRRAMRKKESEKEGKDEPFDYVLMFLADLEDDNLRVLPTHRVVTVDLETIQDRLSDYFEIYELPPDADIINEIGKSEHAFGLYTGGDSYILKYKGEDAVELHPALSSLDVVVLHKIVFGRLLEVGSWAYEMDYDKVREMVNTGEYDAAFFLNPTPVRDVKAVALAGLRMPPKSTYFYPKVQTGFVMNSLKSF
jgi:uncharacterized protein (DUF1015 family)